MSLGPAPSMLCPPERAARSSQSQPKACQTWIVALWCLKWTCDAVDVEGGDDAALFVLQFHVSPSTLLWDNEDGWT